MRCSRETTIASETPRLVGREIARGAAGDEINSSNCIPGNRGDPRTSKCSGLDKLHSRFDERSSTDILPVDDQGPALEHEGDPRTRREEEEELWNRTFVTYNTVTRVDPPAGVPHVEHRQPVFTIRAFSSSSSLARDVPLFGFAGLLASSNFTICRARRGRTHHRRARKRPTQPPTGYTGGYWHRGRRGF